ncbi:serine hydrolase [Methylocapsa sp. S129]|uniref:serine hydrolase domain-containing protein n=1 Tax=Methylocapsa sp. S129 TaxID=1641869 RepID=UPI00131ADAD1|nr:serine hydrolase domain-containing protein [Methylocapsa sp. S129]
MERWLQPALEYILSWIQFQMRMSEQPGCVLAIAHRDRIVLERAFGHADLVKDEKLTPRHRFRVASHSKSFTAAGILRLREQRKLRLDDPVGQYVKGLHPEVAEVTIGQLLSHSAGIIRDGADAGQFIDNRPFLNRSELTAELRRPLAIEPNTRFKYSNHGFGLLGLVIEAIAKEPYRAWIKREIVDAAGLRETEPDMPIAKGAPFARGHTPKLPLGRRLVIPGDNPTDAIAPAAGFVSTAGDLALYFAQLAPKAKQSVLSVGSRREMIRRQWRNPHSGQESYYGLGVNSGALAGWDWFGHGGALQGYISRTCVLPAPELTLSVMTNATDGPAGLWVDGMIHMLRAFATRGAPTRRTRDWSGRWWSTWGPLDLVPMSHVVLAASPHFINPFMDATEIEVTGRDKGRIALANGYANHGEPVRRTRNKSGAVAELWLSAVKLRPEAKVAAEMERRYGTAKRRKAV